MTISVTTAAARWDPADVELCPVSDCTGTRHAEPPAWWTSLDGTHNRYVVDCPGHEHRIGLVKHDGHLVYRPHTITTHGGLRLPCSLSLVRFCDGPPLLRRSVLCACGDAPEVIR